MADVTVTADPIELTSSILGDGLVVYIVADPIYIYLMQMGNLALHDKPGPRNPELDIEYDCSLLGNDGLEIGITILTVDIFGAWLNVHVVASPITITVSIINNEEIVGEFFSDSALINIAVTIKSYADIITEGVRKNWIKWSNIGNLDFTIWKDNIAGERPLDWKGWIYSIKKLGSKLIVYGENGVSLLVPSGNVFGLLPVYKIGLKGKQAIAGDDKIHFFVDNTGRLFSIGETAMKSSLFDSSITPERLDYSEYLGTMNDLVLSWDALNNLLYICDGLIGYVYSVDSKSLGSGPVNITGVGSQGNTYYISAPATIVNEPFEICTDIYDMGSRKNKTIHSIELGTDTIGDLWVAIDYRSDKASPFVSLSWHKVSPNGVTVIPCYGIEFRIKVKRTTYAKLELDYIRVNGIIHDYKFLYPYVGR